MCSCTKPKSSSSIEIKPSVTFKDQLLTSLPNIFISNPFLVHSLIYQMFRVWQNVPHIIGLNDCKCKEEVNVYIAVKMPFLRTEFVSIQSLHSPVSMIPFQRTHCVVCCVLCVVLCCVLCCVVVWCVVCGVLCCVPCIIYYNIPNLYNIVEWVMYIIMYVCVYVYLC